MLERALVNEDPRAVETCGIGHLANRLDIFGPWQLDIYQKLTAARKLDGKLALGVAQHNAYPARHANLFENRTALLSRRNRCTTQEDNGNCHQ